MEFRKLKLVVFLVALFVASVYAYFALYRLNKTSTVRTGQTEETISTLPSDEPKKTEFGDKLPTGFPVSIPLEQDIHWDQNYSLDYSGWKQFTTIFSSRETVKKNYDLYTEFLKKDEWTISDTHESDEVSSLHALKERNELNATFLRNQSNGDVKSQVSISILEK